MVALHDEAAEIAEAMKKGAEEQGRNAKYMTWRDRADWVLGRLFDNGNFTPSPKEIFDAYPFGPRKYWPYKVWLKQVKWWREGGRQPLRKRPQSDPLPGQEALL